MRNKRFYYAQGSNPSLEPKKIQVRAQKNKGLV